MDDELTRRADLVFVASETLLESKRRLNPETHVSPHGVDFAHFVRAQDPALPVPDDIAALPHPVVGFFGLIERWIDLGLVDWLAEQRPHWTFLMIGRVAVPDAEVPRRPNLVYLGRRPYESLPAYGKAFSAALIPYHLTPQVLHANPIKLREYLAMGKPIVSVSTPEIDKFSAHVRIGRSREELLAHLDAAVEIGLTPCRHRRADGAGLDHDLGREPASGDRARRIPPGTRLSLDRDPGSRCPALTVQVSPDPFALGLAVAHDRGSGMRHRGPLAFFAVALVGCHAGIAGRGIRPEATRPGSAGRRTGTSSGSSGRAPRGHPPAVIGGPAFPSSIPLRSVPSRPSSHRAGSCWLAAASRRS